MSSIPGRVARPTDAPAGKRRGGAQDVRAQLHDHLRKTARFIKYLDGVVLLFALAAFLLGVWLVACVIDHWLSPLSPLGRWSIWTAAVAGSLWWSVRYFVPLALGRINPTYAAKRIENLVPEFKNGLVSWLELESMPDHGVPRGVMAAIAYRAARFIGGQDPSSTVDTSPLIKLVGCFLLLLVSLALYMMLSPKSAFVTAERVLMPWRSVEAPARVHFQSIQPGTVELTEGETLTVDVEVNGLRRDEPVVVKFTTKDGQFQQQRVELQAVTEGFRYSGEVKTTSVGVEHALSYWLEAGDALAGPFEVSLNPLPSVVLESVELQFPKYTRLPTQTVTGREIEAVEGTLARITARANQSMSRGRVEIGAEVDDRGELIRATAYVEMDVDDRRLTADWLMRLNDDGDNPTQLGYRIRGYNQRKNVNPNPIMHRMAVLADVAPEIELLGPESRTLRVHSSARVNLEVRAIDPDFGLNRIDMNLSVNGKQKSQQTILEGDGIVGRQVKTTQLDLAKLRLAIGDRIQIRATALDNRHDPLTQAWKPNTSESEPLMLEVVGPDQPDDIRSQPPQQPESDQPSDASSAGQENTTGAGASGDNRNSQPTQSGSESDAASGSQSTGATGSQSSGESGSESSAGGAGGSSGESADSQSEASQQNSGGGSSASGSESNQASAASGGAQQSSESGGQSSQQRSASGSQTSAGQQRTASDSAASDATSGENGASAAKGGAQGGSAGEPAEKSHAEPTQSDREALDRVRKFMQSQESQTSDGQANSGERSSSPPQNNLGGRQQASPSSSAEQSTAATSGSQQSESEQSSAQQSASQQSGSEQSSSPQSGTEQSGSQQSGSEQPGAQQSGSQQSGSQQTGSEQSSAQQSASQQSGSQQSGSQQSSSQQSASEPSGSQQSSSPQSGSQQAGSQQSGSEQSSSQQQASEQSASEQSGSRQSGAEQSRSQQSGSEQSGSQSGSQQSSSPQSGSQPSDSQQSSSAQSSSQQSGSQQPSSEQSGSEQSGSQQSGSQESGAQESGAQESGAPESRTQESGSQQSESQQSGSQQSGGESSASSSGSQQSSSQASGSQPPSGSNGGGPSTGNSSSGENSTRGGAGGGSGERDAVNAEDAAKTTNMVLDYLNRQKDQPDPELLREVNWTEAELREFVDRWTEARDLASQGDASAKRRWEELLRNLELGPSGGTAKAGSTHNDDFQQMLDSGTRMRPPESLRKQYEAFRRAMQKP